ncbi:MULTISPECIES: putative lipid II flippase FtsW [unclassified Actinomyces]|uniref:putative lipid II flippase FtsW n=1 Tax=unclassified Actinomyces TaxID=2609248 RepID=UPI0013A6E3B0|nr:MULTISPECIES: putative lipid II flippase FtsW [unclassified Actinomyces]MBW3069732.1 putative lipid II flippase FtsW [Actinomyces sp. 594]NDR52761.1 putative lipid II flippase FtsW [Actinomyces sp. 565]
MTETDMTPARRWSRRARFLRGADGPVEGESSTLSYYALLVSTLALLAFGLIMVFSVQSVTTAADGGNAFTAFSKYLVFAVIGLLGMWVLSRLRPRSLKRLAWPALLASFALQLLVFVPGIGIDVYGNRNWIQLPAGLGTAQPSEFIKLGLCLYLGVMVSRHRDAFIGGVRTGRDLARFLGWILLPAGLGIGLVMAGGDLGTVIVLTALVAGALWLGGLGWRWFAALGGIGLLGFAAASMLSANRRARILAWLHPDRYDPLDVGYQPQHGRYALGTGGLRGVGPGSSRQKWGYLTQADSDYIFAVLGEEFGLVGTLFVIALFVVVAWCCLRIVRRSQSLYVAVVTSGIMTWIVGQALINMSVVVGLLPVLGVPLPLVSAGGSALVSVLLAVGVLLAFARNEPGASAALRSRTGAVRRTLAVIAPRRRKRA